ncbi:hypothetical protein [Streptomyces sp. H27-D2]|uniref:hypothetical protein n=1 Tax=Streptomyces sp. H27-D2 TaxID=3046304 RepID=UPI002DB8E390|nr:hypothetical protein [Streptomyces sp. H27-D2]MEC4015399.1 hypothetical protein [Streptomyces sp. H27-D2]
MTRLIREIEGLSAAGRLPVCEPGFVRGRAEFVASCLVRRGLPEADALVKATLLNSAFASLQSGFLITGDRDRTEGALNDLCTWIETCVACDACVGEPTRTERTGL